MNRGPLDVIETIYIMLCTIFICDFYCIRYCVFLALFGWRETLERGVDPLGVRWPIERSVGSLEGCWCACLMGRGRRWVALDHGL
jgi:hypothetical protein